MVKQVAGCIITDANHRVLLIHRSTERLKQWELPGGKVEENESPAEAAIRETFEEVNLEVTELTRVGATEFDDNNQRWHYTWFIPGEVKGEAKLMEESFDGLCFMDVLSAEIEDKVLSPNILAIIEALKNKQFNL